MVKELPRILNIKNIPEGFVFKDDVAIKKLKSNNGRVVLEYYGGDLCFVSIDGADIEDIPEFMIDGIYAIPEPTSDQDEHMYRLSKAAEEYIVSIINS